MMTKVLHSLEVPVLVAVPLVMGLCAYFQIEQGALLTLLVVFAALSLMFEGWEKSKPALRHGATELAIALLSTREKDSV